MVIRARVFSTKIGDREIAIGPGYIVDQLLLILDRQIDRQRALVRTQLVKEKMAKVEFQRVAAYVSTMILGSRQSMSLQDQEDLANQVKLVQEQPTGEREKAFALGFLILDFMGEQFLGELVKGIDALDLGGMKAPAPAARVPAPIEDPAPVDRSNLVRSRLTGVSFAEACNKLEQALASDQATTPEQKAALKQALEDFAAKERAAREEGASEKRFQLLTYNLGFAVFDEVGPDFLKQVFERPR